MSSKTAFDLVIIGGRVVDPESGFDAIADVGVRDGVIAAVSTDESLTGIDTIDAAGLIVAPGFIDLHVHSQDDHTLDLSVRDGVTTALELELGAYPLQPFYERRAATARMHYGASVGYQLARLLVADGIASPTMSDFDAESGERRRRAGVAAQQRIDDAQIAAVHAAIVDEVRAGGLGVGLGMEYTQGADHVEIQRLFFALQGTDAVVFVHTREFTSTHRGKMLANAQEVIADAAVTGVPLHIVHVSSKGLEDTPDILAAIRGAQARGIDVTTEVPSYAMATGVIGSALFSEGWRDRWLRDYSDLENLETGERFTEATFTELLSRDPDALIMKHITPESATRAAMAEPGVLIASDAVPVRPGEPGNPRAAGTFSRTLGRYVRELGIFELTDAIARMTVIPARRIEAMSTAMQSKGRLRVGMDGDITVFDAATVIDRATGAEPSLAPVGIPHVIVAGRPVVRDGALRENEYPGRPIVADRLA
ncbi:amidohydrolase family protein [Microbacterium trichothecenolyticum]|uniref:amidohydrolase family protein n=1 Tax=Microbacterium trichothecenolyticum TaxID=69370 RepID=UPI001C6E000C|nr:amidohydrolase family protein [Microbacterium trichothecenolyticum]MBW9121939.1 amidohydrolase family protein [Microbacterium trichothecenolyticum]